MLTTVETMPSLHRRWIAFDAVGTLIHPVPPVAIAYQGIAARYGSSVSVEEIRDRFGAAFRRTEMRLVRGGADDEQRYVTSEEHEADRWRLIVRELIHDLDDTEACFRELFDHFAQPSSWKCFDDVGEPLNRLHRAGYRLAVASNFDRRLHAICNALPELAMIETRVISSEVGFRKPAPQFYRAMLHACDCAPEALLMVGDEAENDLTGPSTVGIPALLLIRQDATSSSHSIHSMHELVDRLT